VSRRRGGKGYFVEQLVGGGERGRSTRVEGDEGVADEGVGGEEAELSSEHVQLQAAAEVCRALEGRNEEHGQRGAAAGYSQKGRRSFAARLASEGSRKGWELGRWGCCIAR
jgi:hypothetical protein